MLNWAKQFSIFCFLDNNKYNFFSLSFECLLAAGAVKKLEMTAGNAFDALQQFKEDEQDWLFGHLSYDLKNEIENLSSGNLDKVHFPDISFFVPQILLMLNEHELKIGVIDTNADKIYDAVFSSPKNIETSQLINLDIKSRFTKEEYLLCI